MPPLNFDLMKSIYRVSSTKPSYCGI